jgi:hypothetical protein
VSKIIPISDAHASPIVVVNRLFEQIDEIEFLAGCAIMKSGDGVPFWSSHHDRSDIRVFYCAEILKEGLIETLRP